MTGDGSSGRVSRRAMLLTAGGLAAAGGGLAAGIGLSQSAGAAPEEGRPGREAAVPTPGEDLMTDHGLLIRILLIYRRLGALAAAGKALSAPHLHDSALIIHDYIEAFHEELEEAYIFPRLQRAGRLTDTVSTLLLQHARGRELTQLILASTSAGGMVPARAVQAVSGAMAAFVRMYEPHEAREDTVVYPAFRALLSATEISDLGQHFASLEQRQLGRGGFGALVSRVADIEQALGVYDLNQFTPANIVPPAS